MVSKLDNGESPCDGRAKHRLRVYITSECFSCNEAVVLAAEVTQRFPQVITEIINLDDPCAAKPDSVFAVPTYVLDDEIISLGNPYTEQLFDRISSALADNRINEEALGNG